MCLIDERSSFLSDIVTGSAPPITSDVVAPVAPAPVAVPVQPAQAPAVTPVQASPAVTAPAPSKAPEPQAAKAPEAVHHTETKTLLDEPFDTADKPPAEVKTAPQEREPVVYEFQVPEDIKAAPEHIERAQKVLNELGLPKEIGPKALAAHYEELRQYAASEVKRWNEQFMNVRKEQVAKVMADPELGNPEARKVARRMRDALVPEADRADFDHMISVTGAGDFIAMSRLLYRMNGYVEQRVSEAVKAATAPYKESAQPSPMVLPVPNAGRAPGVRGLRAVYQRTGG
jgi:hypothetical protein